MQTITRKKREEEVKKVNAVQFFTAGIELSSASYSFCNESH